MRSLTILTLTCFKACPPKGEIVTRTNIPLGYNYLLAQNAIFSIQNLVTALQRHEDPRSTNGVILTRMLRKAF